MSRWYDIELYTVRFSLPYSKRCRISSMSKNPLLTKLLECGIHGQNQFSFQLIFNSNENSNIHQYYITSSTFLPLNRCCTLQVYLFSVHVHPQVRSMQNSKSYSNISNQQDLGKHNILCLIEFFVPLLLYINGRTVKQYCSAWRYSFMVTEY